MSSVFKIEVFDALQTRFGPSQYTSLKYSFKSQPQIENEDVTWSPRYNLPATRTNKHRALSLQEVELDGWFLIYSHCTENMYHIIHAQVYYEFCISFLYSWIDVLDSNQPFDWGAKIWEPFKMKLIWGLQSWALHAGETRCSKSQVDLCKASWTYARLACSTDPSKTKP